MCYQDKNILLLFQMFWHFTKKLVISQFQFCDITFYFDITNQFLLFHKIFSDIIKYLVIQQKWFM